MKRVVKGDRAPLPDPPPPPSASSRGGEGGWHKALVVGGGWWLLVGGGGRLDADDSAYREYFAWKTEGAAPGFAHTLLTSAVLWPCHLCDEMQYLYELKWRWREGRRARACGARNCSAGVRRAGGHVVRPS